MTSLDAVMVAGLADGGGGEVGSVSGSVSGGRVDGGGLEGGWLVGGGALDQDRLNI